MSHFPPHVCYVEPFGGAMSVLLRKAPSRLEVYNDLDGEVVLFFQVLRERTEELVEAITWTPFSRAELDLAYEIAEDDLERARRFYVRAWQGRGGPRAMWRTGWRYQKTNARGKRALDDFNDTTHLWAIARRLKEVQIECVDALRVLRAFDAPSTLFYVDPPYVWASRSERWAGHAYEHDMDDSAHRALAEALHQVEGAVLLSGYPSALYDELYGDWDRVSKEAKTDQNTTAMEVLWISPVAQRARMPLLAFCEEVG